MAYVSMSFAAFQRSVEQICGGGLCGEAAADALKRAVSEGEEFSRLPPPLAGLRAEDVASLGRAACVGDAAEVRALLSASADPQRDVSDRKGLKALHLAAAGGHRECAALLLRAGASASTPFITDREYVREDAGPRAGSLVEVSRREFTALLLAANDAVRQLLVDAGFGYLPAADGPEEAALKVSVSFRPLTDQSAPQPQLDGTPAEFVVPRHTPLRELRLRVADHFQLAVLQVKLQRSDTLLFSSQDAASVGALLGAEAHVELQLTARPVQDAVTFAKLLGKLTGLQEASEELKADKEFVIQAVKLRPWEFKHVPKTLQNDREVVLALVKQMPDLFTSVPEQLRGDREVVLAAVAKDGNLLNLASDELKADKDCFLAALAGGAESGSIFSDAPANLRGDVEVVLAVMDVKRHFDWASEELRDNRDVVMATLDKGNGLTYPYASKRLQADPEVALKALRCQWCTDLRYLSKDLMCDRGFAFSIIRQRLQARQQASGLRACDCTKPMYLDCFSEELRRDPEFVLEFLHLAADACSLRGSVAAELRDDREFVIAACKLRKELDYGPGIELASARLQFDKELILSQHDARAFAFAFASEELRSDKEVMLAAMKARFSFNKVAEELKADREVALAALRAATSNSTDNANEVFKQLPEALRGDRELALEAIRRHGAKCLQGVTPELRDDRELVLAAVVNERQLYDWEQVLEHVSEDLRGDKEVMLEAVKKSALAYPFATEKLRSDKEVLLTALAASETKWFQYRELPEAAQPDNACHHFIRAFDKAPLELQLDPDVHMLLFPLLQKVQAQDISTVLNSLRNRVPKELLGNAKFVSNLFSDVEKISPASACKFVEDECEKLRCDGELMLAYARCEKRLHYKIHDALTSDKEFMLKAVEICGFGGFNRASEELRGNRDFVMRCLEMKVCNYKNISQELKADREILMKMIQINAAYLKHAPDGLKADKEIAMAAVKLEPLALQVLPEELLGDRELVMAAVKLDGTALKFAPQGMRGDKEVVQAAVDCSPDALQDATEEMRGDRELGLAAVSHPKNRQLKCSALKLLSKDLQAEKAVVLAAVKCDPRAFWLASLELQCDEDVFLAFDQQHRTGQA